MESKEAEDDDKAHTPRDLQFVLGMMDRECRSPKLPLPECKDSLFVTKPFDKYEPIINFIRTFLANMDNVSKHNPKISKTGERPVTKFNTPKVSISSTANITSTRYDNLNTYIG